MTLKTTYQNIKTNYPDVLKKLESQLRSGRSKYKDAPIEDFEYTFVVAERIEGISGMDFVNKLNSGELFNEKEEETVEEVVQRRLSNSTSIVQMKTPTAIYTQTLAENVPEAERAYRETELEDRAEQERFDNLPDNEKNDKIEDLLNELSSMGGFFSIR